MKVDWGHYLTVHPSQVSIGIQHCQCISPGLRTTLSGSHLLYDLESKVIALRFCQCLNAIRDIIAKSSQWSCWWQPVSSEQASIIVNSRIVVGGFWCHFFVFMFCSCAVHLVSCSNIFCCKTETGIEFSDPFCIDTRLKCYIRLLPLFKHVSFFIKSI